jgi:hypothetical protein
VLRLFLGAVGDDDAADALLIFLESLEDDAIVKGSDVQGLVVLS